MKNKVKSEGRKATKVNPKAPVVKNVKGAKVAITSAASKNVPTTRDKAKEMSRAARHIARANGKRITMAMFFVEDL